MKEVHQENVEAMREHLLYNLEMSRSSSSTLIQEPIRFFSGCARDGFTELSLEKIRDCFTNGDYASISICKIDTIIVQAHVYYGEILLSAGGPYHYPSVDYFTGIDNFEEFEAFLKCFELWMPYHRHVNFSPLKRLKDPITMELLVRFIWEHLPTLIF